MIESEEKQAEIEDRILGEVGWLAFKRRIIAEERFQRRRKPSRKDP